MSKWTATAWWFCVKRKFLPMIVSGLVIGVISAIKIDMGMLIGLPLLTAGMLGTMGSLMFGTVSWLFSDPEVFSAADAVGMLDAIDGKFDDADVDVG